MRFDTGKIRLTWERQTDNFHLFSGKLPGGSELKLYIDNQKISSHYFLDVIVDIHSQARTSYEKHEDSRHELTAYRLQLLETQREILSELKKFNSKRRSG